MSLRRQVTLVIVTLGLALLFALSRVLVWTQIGNQAVGHGKQQTLAAVEQLARAYGDWFRTQDGGDVAPQDEAIGEITERVLRDFPGVEGGFHGGAPESFYGFSFPTSPEPRPAYGPPPREVGLLERLSRESRSTGTVRYEWHEGYSDFGVAAVLVPSAISGGATPGVAWALMRVNLPTSPTSDPWLLAAFGLALAGGALGMWVVLDLRRQAALLRGGIRALGDDLRSPMPHPTDSEFAAIARAIDTLAESLAESRRTETQLAADLARNERLAALGRLVAGIAHEVRTPLAGIKTRLQLWLRRAPDVAANDPTLPAVIEQIDRISGLVENLYGLARVGQMPLEQQDLAKPVGVAVSDMQGAAAVRGARLSVEIAGDLPFASLNSVAIGQLVTNLIANALEAGASRVRIAAAARNGTVELVVHDNGSGVPADGSERWFEPLFSTRADGLGMGLAICYEVARHHGGTLAVGASPDGGAAFTLTLPVVQPVAAREG